MSEAALCWPAFRFHYKSEIRLKPPRKVQGSVSTTPMMVVTWDILLAFLSRCQQSIYNFNLKPDVNGWFCTVLTQVLTSTESIQSSKSEFSKGRERAQNPKSINTFKLQALFLQVKLHIQLKCLTYPTKSRAFFLPCSVMRSCMEWDGQGKELQFGSFCSAYASATHLWYVLVWPPWHTCAKACVWFNVTFPEESMF